MARITVEDCLEHVDNRFELVLVAAKRTRQLTQGAEPCVDRENDKSTVIALREIADGFVTSAILDEESVQAVLEADEDILNQDPTLANLISPASTDQPDADPEPGATRQS